MISKMSFNSNFNVELPVFKDNEINIASVGAISGGIVSNTKIINDAIDMLFKKGGGRIIIPSGIYLTGPIKLLSGINLHIEKGAVLLFSKNKEEYPLIRADYEGQPRIRTVSPISAYDAENIAITGGGSNVISPHSIRSQSIVSVKISFIYCQYSS